MLEITVKLVPYGIRSQGREIARASIGNISSGTPSTCDYQVSLSDDRGIEARFDAMGIYRDEDVWRFLLSILQKRPVE